MTDATLLYPSGRVIAWLMRRPPVDTPEWYRDEAERCFRLAEKMTDQKSVESLVAYGRELLGQAERMEATLAAAIVERPADPLLDEAG